MRMASAATSARYARCPMARRQRRGTRERAIDAMRTMIARRPPSKTPSSDGAGRCALRVPDDDLLSHGSSVLSSAYCRFTVLFGMGRGGAGRLWSSGVEGEGKGGLGISVGAWVHNYGVKPHGLLVPVSSTHYCASTPGLSTWWSATVLQGDQVPGRSHLQARFPLRCFQRLSLPYIATQRCLWRDNWYTSGTSTPVLSY